MRRSQFFCTGSSTNATLRVRHTFMRGGLHATSAHLLFACGQGEWVRKENTYMHDRVIQIAPEIPLRNSVLMTGRQNCYLRPDAPQIRIEEVELYQQFTHPPSGSACASVQATLTWHAFSNAL